MKNSSFLSRLSRFVDGDSPSDNNALDKDSAGVPNIDTDNAENRWLSSVQTGEKPLTARLENWFSFKGVNVFDHLYRIAAAIICLTLIGVLLSVVSFLPPFGGEDNPAVNEVVERYVSKSVEETGTVNTVSGMISAYRGFDTLGEAHVLFIAACSVIVLLRINPSSGKKDALVPPDEDIRYEPNNDIILSQISSLLVPLTFIFGLYVILNGTSSPGGGFSGGALIGAGLILHSVAFGFQHTGLFFNDKVYHVVKTVCLTIYALLMAYFIYMGANGLDNHIWLGNSGGIISGGLILPINVAVGFEVACTMYCFYALFRKGGL